MKKLALLLALAATAAYADCRQFTVVQPGGQVVSCVQCCDGNNPCTIICGN